MRATDSGSGSRSKSRLIEGTNLASTTIFMEEKKRERQKEKKLVSFFS